MVPGKAYIKEVVLENFMSYEYSRVRFSPHLNIITGPNGAGKSSILLAISVALGMSHTERSRRLSGLIRMDKDYSIVSVILNNMPGKDGSRPFPYIRSDEVVITRVLRRDGQYFFQINYRSSSKAEVEAMLRSAGINPDNMLIIMHQNMVEAFGFIDPKEKLWMFEEALGLKEYRDRIIDARSRLERISGEEREVRGLLEDARENLSKWEALYRRLLEKRRLEERLNMLYRELAWSKYYRIMDRVKAIEADISRIEDEIHRENIELMKIRGRIRDANEEFSRYIEDLWGIYIDLAGASVRRDIAGRIEDLLNKIRESRDLYGRVMAMEAVTLYKIDRLESELSSLRSQHKVLMGECREAKLEAEKYGDPIESGRDHYEIMAEIREVKGRLQEYRDVDEDVEATYQLYRNKFYEIKARLEKILSDKVEAEKELEKRVRIWRSKVLKAVESVSRDYNEILSRLNGTGFASIINIDDVEKAGLELYVGFGGLEASALDIYSKSGGERTIAAMSFLLALQKYIKSPFRAVDEFDVHMDPRNREIILDTLIELMGDVEGQYILITPGYISSKLSRANVIVVQKVEGMSRTRVLEAVGDA